MTEEEFIKIWTQAALPRPVFYRLYHDDQGVPLFYSMEDLPGTYLEIDQETYARNDSNVRVINGKLCRLSNNLVSRLVVSDQGTRCHPNDVSIVVDQSQPGQHWSLKTDVYEEY